LQPIAALRLEFLEERHAALVAELAEDGWTVSQRLSKTHALAVIDAAIERRSA
jgi:hypothetical protein